MIREHLADLEDRIAEDGSERGLPDFVRNALSATASCGDFCRGFALLSCDRCTGTRVLPFSCKSRICPSCAGRTMADRAAHLVDRVLRPELRWRQWVFTFPAELAVGLCFHADLAAAVLRVCMRVLFEWQRARSSVQTAVRLHPAAVVQVQRHSDGAGCWYHLHVLAADGVFYEPQGTLEVPFETQPPPGEADVAQLAERIAARVLGLLRRRGPQAEAPEQTLLRRCASAVFPLGARRPLAPGCAEGSLGDPGAITRRPHPPACEARRFRRCMRAFRSPRIDRRTWSGCADISRARRFPNPA